MAPLGALSQAWTSAEAALPLCWRLSGLYRFDDLWIGLAEGPAFEDYASGSGQYAEQALRRLSDRLRERRGSASGFTLTRLDHGAGRPQAAARIRIGSQFAISSNRCHGRE